MQYSHKFKCRISSNDIIYGKIIIVQTVGYIHNTYFVYRFMSSIYMWSLVKRMEQPLGNVYRNLCEGSNFSYIDM